MKDKTTWTRFIRDLMGVIGKDRPDLVSNNTLIISDTTIIDGYNWLLHRYSILKDTFGYNMPIDKSKDYLAKAVEQGNITFNEIVTKNEKGDKCIVYGVTII